MKRLLFFINPNAGHAEIRSSLMEVLAIFCKGGYEPTVHMTTGPRDITRQIAERGTQYDLIVCTRRRRDAQRGRLRPHGAAV